jgi:hypothetical protein
MKPEYFGVHSIRKGAITHAECGVTSSPPIASICIHANWKMPEVMNRYTRYENARDQYVGRYVSDRSRLKKEFAESFPYWDFSELDDSEKTAALHDLDTWIKSQMSGDGMNDNVFSIFKMCLASFVHHRKWLDDQIHSDNALRCSIFWNDSIPYSDGVGTHFPWTKTVDTPEIAGLPLDVLYMAKVETLTMKFEKLIEAVLNDNNRIAKEIIEEFNR